MKTLTANQNILDFKMAWAFKVADDITATCKKNYLEDIKSHLAVILNHGSDFCTSKHNLF